MAHELGRVNLAEALELTILVGRKEPRRLSRIAVRWLERYIQECEPTLAQVALAVSALSALANEQPAEASRLLRALIGSFELARAERLAAAAKNRRLEMRLASIGGNAVDLAGPSITMSLGKRKLPLTRAEANDLHNLLVERNLALLALQSELARALQTDSGQPNVLADEEMRQELLLCLDAAETELQLEEGLRRLRQAARVPLSPKPEY